MHTTKMNKAVESNDATTPDDEEPSSPEAEAARFDSSHYYFDDDDLERNSSRRHDTTHVNNYNEMEFLDAQEESQRVVEDEKGNVTEYGRTMRWRRGEPSDDDDGEEEELSVLADHYDDNNVVNITVTISSDDDENDNGVRISPQSVPSPLADTENDHRLHHHHHHNNAMTQEEQSTNTTTAAAAAVTTTTTRANDRPPALYKSTRLKGYMTILLASVIFYDAAQKSTRAYAAATVPATRAQKVINISIASVSMGVSGPIVGLHLLTPSLVPCRNITTWPHSIFRPASRIEFVLALFLFLWWAAAVGWQTSIQGVAGDGKGQYSLYYSAWVNVYAAFFAVLEPWWLAAGWKSSLRAFVQSWPHRAPGWLCLWALSLMNLVWIVDLWRNYPTLKERPETQILYYYFYAVPTGQWQFLLSLSVFTIVAASGWVLVELLRQTTPEGRKAPAEVMAEGICIFILLALWIPSIMLATTSGGFAALVGNTYFFSWAVVIFLAETAVWFVHDLRDRMHESLAAKAEEYRTHQQHVMAQAEQYRQQQQQAMGTRMDQDVSNTAPEFFDAMEF